MGRAPSGRPRRLKLIAALVIFVGLVSSMLALQVRSGTPSQAAFEAQYAAACGDFSNTKCANEVYLEQVKHRSPYEVIRMFASSQLPGSSAACHSLLHAVGQYAAAKHKYSKQALLSGFCQDGYLHGWVIKSSQISDRAISDEVIPFCDELAGSDEELGGACAHSLGHALFSSAHLGADRSYAACSKATGVFDCAEGVSMEFMTELFGSDRASDLSYHRDLSGYETNWSLANCDARSHPKISGSCIRAVAYVVAQEHDAPMEWLVSRCAALSDDEMRSECATGVGLGIGRRIIAAPDSAVVAAAIASCTGILGEDRCFASVARQAADAAGSPARGAAMCQLFPAADRQRCTDELQGWATRAGDATATSSPSTGKP